MIAPTERQLILHRLEVASASEWLFLSCNTAVATEYRETFLSAIKQAADAAAKDAVLSGVELVCWCLAALCSCDAEAWCVRMVRDDAGRAVQLLRTRA